MRNAQGWDPGRPLKMDPFFRHPYGNFQEAAWRMGERALGSIAGYVVLTGACGTESIPSRPLLDFHDFSFSV